MNIVNLNSIDWNSKKKLKKLNIICSEKSLKLKNLLSLSREIITNLVIYEEKKVVVFWRQNTLQQQILKNNIRQTKKTKIVIKDVFVNLNKVIQDKENLLILDKDESKDDRYITIDVEGKKQSLHKQEISNILISNYDKSKDDNLLIQCQNYIKDNCSYQEQCTNCELIKPKNKLCVFCVAFIKIAKVQNIIHQRKQRKNNDDDD